VDVVLSLVGLGSVPLLLGTSFLRVYFLLAGTSVADSGAPDPNFRSRVERCESGRLGIGGASGAEGGDCADSESEMVRGGLDNSGDEL
jgi:hypothetical protein